MKILMLLLMAVMGSPAFAQGGGLPIATYGGDGQTPAGETFRVIFIIAKSSADSGNITGDVTLGPNRYNIKGTFKKDSVVEQSGPAGGNTRRRLDEITAQCVIKGKPVEMNGVYKPETDTWEFSFENDWSVRCHFIPRGKKPIIEPPRPLRPPVVAIPRKIVRPPPPTRVVRRPPAKPKQASARTWGLVEVINDPNHLTHTEGVNNWKSEYEYRINHYRLDLVDWADAEHTKYNEDFHFNVRLEAPPPEITAGKPFELTVLATCTGARHTQSITRWGWYTGYMEPKLVRAGKGSPDGTRSGVQVYCGFHHQYGYEPTASGVYLFSPTDSLPDEFVINQVCDGKLATFKYRRGVAPVKIKGL